MKKKIGLTGSTGSLGKTILKKIKNLFLKYSKMILEIEKKYLNGLIKII